MYGQFKSISRFSTLISNFKRIPHTAICNKEPSAWLHRVTHSASSGADMAKSVGESHNFPKEEEHILEMWKKLDAFKTSVKQSEGKPRYNAKTELKFECRRLFNFDTPLFIAQTKVKKDKI